LHIAQFTFSHRNEVNRTLINFHISPSLKLDFLDKLEIEKTSTVYHKTNSNPVGKGHQTDARINAGWQDLPRETKGRKGKSQNTCKPIVGYAFNRSDKKRIKEMTTIVRKTIF